MKKTLLIFTLLFSLHSFGQDYTNLSNPVSDLKIFMGTDYLGIDNAVIVPEGKFWTVNNHRHNWYWQTPNGNEENFYLQAFTAGTALPAGYKLYCLTDESSAHIIIYEHNYITDTSLSSTNVEFPNQIRLFPNPTTSEVALNSDKQYDIEVYDILGNKVMELTGNTIDMEHLSSATYIVNALDTETNERLSYKVIKN